ncbi:MAG: hypothetical protein M3Y69_02525 [Verrucomicrobiota bacterium]|nr:hypothetical protein [Verrucomicrobiota bacterium]
MVRLESIEIGGLRFTEITAGSRSYKSAPRAAELDGIIGRQLFQDYLVTRDFPGKKALAEFAVTFDQANSRVRFVRAAGVSPQ